MAETFIALLTDTWSQCCQCSSLLAVKKWMRRTVLEQNVEQKADWSLLQGRHLLQCRKSLFVGLSSTVTCSSSPSLFSGNVSLWWTYSVKETKLITKKQTEEFRSGCEGEERGGDCALAGINRPWGSTGRSWNPAVLLRSIHKILLQFQGHGHSGQCSLITSCSFWDNQEVLWASSVLVQEANKTFFFVHLTLQKLDCVHSG